MAKPMSEKAKKEEQRKAEQQAMTEGQRRQQREVPRSATAFPARKSRAGGQLTREYAIGDYPDTTTTTKGGGKKATPTPSTPKKAPPVKVQPIGGPPKIAKPVALPPKPLKPIVKPLPVVVPVRTPEPIYRTGPAVSPTVRGAAPSAVSSYVGGKSTTPNVQRPPAPFQQGPLPIPSNVGGKSTAGAKLNPATKASGREGGLMGDLGAGRVVKGLVAGGVITTPTAAQKRAGQEGGTREVAERAAAKGNTQQTSGGVKTSATQKPASPAQTKSTTSSKTTSANTQKTSGGVKTKATPKPTPKPKPPAPKPKPKPPAKKQTGSNKYL